MNLRAYTSITVGVADMDKARALWVDAFGMQTVAEQRGPDAATASLWGIDAGDIAHQLLLSTGDSRFGMLHLVEFKNPAPPVREGAQVFDLCPKNLDVYVKDMPARIAELRAAGFSFRNEHFSEAVAPDGTAFREMHMPSHDAINVVLLEVLGKTKPLSDRGYGSIGPLIYIVPDADIEKTFLRSVLGFSKLNDNILKGPEIEKMVGLPPGAWLDVSIWGDADYPLGELEIVDYQGVEGNDLYSLAKPKATGILHVNFILNDFQPLKAKLEGAGIPFSQGAPVATILGRGPTLRFRSPAGLQFQFQAVPILD